MGVERFFNSLTQVEKIKTNGIIVGLKEKILSNYVYIDFNSVIHNISSEIEYDINYLLYSILLYGMDPVENKLDDITLTIIEKYQYTTADGEVKKFNLDRGITLENFQSTFPKDFLDEIVLTKIKEHIIYITTKLVEPSNVKIIYVAFDGVPQMSKVVEQKKRRYNGHVIGELRAKIFNDTKDSFSELRKTFELHKIGLDRGRITTRGNLMERVSTLLESEIFKNEIKQHHPLLEEFIISNATVYGEGEKKIMEHIIGYGESHVGTYTIYSPDADVVILGLICLNRLHEDSNVSILRFNQQSEEYDFVDIKILRQNIFDMVTKRVNASYLQYINEYTVSNDIAFIFTLFGNDFIPRSEAIDARNDIETLINTYCEYLNKFGGESLIFFENGYRIKYGKPHLKNGLMGYLDILGGIEESLLKETYMAVTYKNYRRLKTILGVSKLLPVLESYISTSNKIFRELKKIGDENQDADINLVEEAVKNVVKDITNLQYMRQFIVFEKKKDNVKEDDSRLPGMFYEECLKKTTMYMEHLRMLKNGTPESQIKKFYFGKLRLEKYDTDMIDTPFHEKNIKDMLPHPKFEISEFEKQSYKLDRKLAEYETKLNSVNFELGNINVGCMYSAKAGNDHYKIYRTNHFSNINTYYETFFGEYKFDQQNFYSSVQEITQEYVLGLIWIFDFYFNKNSAERNIGKVSTWMYPYHRAPLLLHVAQNIGSFQLGTLLSKINESYVNRTEYLNILEHYMYITPRHKMNGISERYNIFITENPEMFPDLTETINRIWTGDNVTEIIDCKRINFLSKCNLKLVPHVTYNTYFKKIKLLRGTEDIPRYDMHNIVHTYQNDNQSGGNNEDIDIEKLKYYRNYFKMLYIKTGILKYKKYYKSIKNQLQHNNMLH